MLILQKGQEQTSIAPDSVRRWDQLSSGLCFITVSAKQEDYYDID